MTNFTDIQMHDNNFYNLYICMICTMLEQLA